MLTLVGILALLQLMPADLSAVTTRTEFLVQAGLGILDDAVLSPESRQLVTAGPTYISVWDLATGAISKQVALPIGNRHMTLVGDGTKLFVNRGSRVHLQERDSGKVLQTFSTATGSIYGPVASTDLSHVAAIAYDGKSRRLVTWDGTTGAELWMSAPMDERGAVACCAISHDGAMLVTGGWSGVGTVWSVAARQPLTTLADSSVKGLLKAAEFSPDGTRLLTANYDGGTRLWDLSTSSPAARLLRSYDVTPAPGWALDVAFSPDGTKVLVGYMDSKARLWDVESGRLLHVLSGHQEGPDAVSFSADGQTAMTASTGQIGDQTVRLWDIASGECLRTYTGHTCRMDAALFTPDGKHVIVRDGRDRTSLWDPSTGQVIRKLPGNPWPVVFSPSGQQVAVGTGDGIEILTADFTRRVRRLEAKEPGSEYAFSPDEKTLLTAGGGSRGRDGMARLWNLQTGRLRHELTTDMIWPSAAAIMPDGRTCLTAATSRTGWVGNFQLWELSSGRRTRLFELSAGIKAAVLLPKGYQVIATCEDQTLKRFDLKRGKWTHTYSEAEPMNPAIALSPDGTKLLNLASDSSTVVLSDVATGERLVSFTGHPEISSVAFSRDGTKVLTASSQGTWRIWLTP